MSNPLYHVKPSDFEDMMRPVVRAAMDQGFMITKTASGHYKFLPPKGPPVILSGTNAAYHPNVKKLQEVGLKYFNGQTPAKEEKAVETPVEAPAAPLPITPALPREQKPQRTGLSVHMLEVLKAANKPLHVDEIAAALQVKHPGVKGYDLSGNITPMVAKCDIVRVGRGVYRAAEVKEKPQLSSEEQAMLAEDEQVLDEFMNALAKLQDWAQKMRQRSIEFNKLKKLLGGL